MDACAALAGLGFGAVLAAVILAESRGSLAAPGGLLSAVGRLAGFAGMYLMLIMVVLVARLPWLERAVGQHQLVRWHRQVAPWAISLITAHVVLIVLGYARAASTGAWHELWVLLTSYRDMLAAAAGFGLLIMAAVASYQHVRRRIKYETWWVIHLYLYLGLALAFAHFLTRELWWQGNPYSLSALPRPPHIRVTIKGLGARAVSRIVPDIAYRDVYICGPDGFSAEIAAAALQLGTGHEQIHTETFGF